MVAVADSAPLTYENSLYLRQRLVLATLSSRPAKFRNIRTDDEKPGLSPSEVSFIRLLDKLSSSTTISINDTGTTLYYKPGILVGGSLSHECHAERGIAYYLQPLLILAPFCKHPLRITMKGVTHAQTDISVDTLNAVSIPLLRRLTLGIPLSPTIDIKKRSISSRSNGEGKGGLVIFTCGITTQKVKAIDLTEAGFIKRIRGLAFANRVSPLVINRIVDRTRHILNDMLADVYIHTDHSNITACGAGFALQLVAESTEGCLIASDWCDANGVEGEKVAETTTEMLLEEIGAAGVVDSANVNLAVMFCALAQQDVNRVKVGKINQSVVQLLRDLEQVWGVRFAVREAKDGGIVLSCVGVGVENVARQRF